MSAALAGLNILVTRPEHQANHLCQLLKEQGAHPLSFPLIDIKPLDTLTAPSLSHYDVIIFVSNNAVQLASPFIKPIMATAKIAAVGKATAYLLQEQGYHVDILPEEQFDTEGLLAHPQLQSVQQQAILIVRGQGGRPVLGDVLQQRGANVEYLAAYQRCLPKINKQNVLQDALQKNALDIILISSSEALQNLLLLTDTAQHDKLRDIQLAVTHPRQAEKAKTLGFTKKMIISPQPGDTPLINALLKWQG